MEYVRGLRNPIGLKVGHDLEARELTAILDRVDPDCEPGRVTLITRFGVEGIEEALPRLIDVVNASGHPFCGRVTRCTATPKLPKMV